MLNICLFVNRAFKPALGGPWKLALANALILAILANATFVHAGPPIKSGKAAKPLSPAVAEMLNYCSGDQLSQKVTQPQCKGYTLPEDYSAPGIEQLYGAAYPNWCNRNTDSPSVFRCLFRFPKHACSAFVDVHNQWGTEQGLPWTATPITTPAGDTQCFYCRKDEPKNQTNHDGKKYCNNGAFLVPLEDPALTDELTPDSAYFCDTMVNGPYSNYPDEYQICGGTQTRAWPGMVYTIDQRKQIKDINKNAMGHNGQLKSDLSGFCWPAPPSGCKPGFSHPSRPNTCKEPETLNETKGSPLQAQIHHIVPKRNGPGCACGKNSMANAAVISASLNSYFSNKDLNTLVNVCTMPEQTEQAVIEALGKYTVQTAIQYRLTRAPKYARPLTTDPGVQLPMRKEGSLR